HVLGLETAMNDAGSSAMPSERSLLIVEDDKSFLQRLARAMEGRGFTVTTAESVSAGLLQVEKAAPAFAVVDMRLGDGNGLDVISAIKKRRPEARAIILTGYGNIATAVNAVKLGAVDYLAKPVDADDVAAALLALDNKKIEPPENPMSADRVRWEHIQRIYELCGRNVSETARRLNMHRRTLQRILARRAPKYLFSVCSDCFGAPGSRGASRTRRCKVLADRQPPAIAAPPHGQNAKSPIGESLRQCVAPALR